MSESDRRSRSRERRLERIYEAAVELFVERGFDNTTMEQIASRADFARATVFNYFPKKTAFLDMWTAKRRARAMSALAQEHADDLPLQQQLGRYLTEMARISEETRDETRALLSATLQQTNFLAHPALVDEMRVLIARSADHHNDADERRTEHAALLIATGYFAVLSRWIAEDDEPFELEPALLDILDIALNGVSSGRS